MFKIIQFVRENDKIGGVGKVSINLEKEFKKNGYKVETFTINNLPLGKYLKSKYSNFFLEKIKLFVSVVYFSIIGSFIAILKNNKNIIIVHNEVIIGDIYINHGIHKEILIKNGYLKMFLKNPLHFFLHIREELKFKLNRFKYIISFSKSDKDKLLKLYRNINPNQIIIIPNGVDLNKFKQNKSLREIIRTEENITVNDFILLFVGNEFERKGLIYLINALKYLPANVKLWIVGNNDSIIEKWNKEITSDLKKRVKFFGKRNDIEKFFNGADLFILPSLYETWALVGVEALACGLPILMTNLDGINEYLEENKNGFFIERDAKDIAEKVLKLKNNKKLYDYMSENAIKTAKKYSWENVAQKYLDIINEVAKYKFITPPTNNLK